MQGHSGRLDQIFPARKVCSPAFSSSSKLNSSPSKRKTESPNDKSPSKSPHKKGTLENYIVNGRNTSDNDNGLAAKSMGEEYYNENSKESRLPKVGGSLGGIQETSTARGYLQQCGAGATKFVPKRLLDVGLREGEDDRGQAHHQQGLEGKDSRTAAHAVDIRSGDASQAANESGEKMVEKEGTHVQFTQFANDFLSICCSGFGSKPLPTSEVMGTSEITTKKRTMLEALDPESSKKPRHDDDLDEDFISCTQPPKSGDISAYSVSWSEHEHENTLNESNMETRNGSPELTNRDNPVLENANGKVVDTPKVDREQREMWGLISAPGDSMTLRPCSKYVDITGGFTKGSVAGCTIETRIIKTVACEVGAALPPIFKSPEEKMQRRGRAANMVSHSTPRTRSKSRGKTDVAALYSTPFSGITRKSGRRSTSISKSGGWQYHSSMFSPGDAFWNEAIEVADGLFRPEEIGIGTSKLSGSACDKVPALEDERPDNQEEGITGVNDEVKDIERDLGSAVCMAMLTSEGKLEGDIRNFMGRLTEVEVSPLPVRRFSFTCQSSPFNEINPVQKPPDLEHLSETFEAGLEAGVEPREPCDIVHEMKVVATSETDMLPKSAPSAVAALKQLVIEQVTAAPCTVAEPSVDVTSNTDSELALGASVKKLCGPFVSVKAETVAEKGKESTPSPTVRQRSLDLSKWLPPEICAIYAKKGLTKLYPWQNLNWFGLRGWKAECLQLDGVLAGRSLVYCASTSAGKSLVAEVLMLRQVLSTGKKALLVLPYVALCSEKADHLDALLEPLGKRVRGYYGAQGVASLPKDTSVAVCTIEKANSLINKLLEEGRLSELAIIVIDELHMVGDRDRGYLLELLLTKLRYAAGGGESVSPGTSQKEHTSTSASWNNGLQIVGMSATMPNVSDVATWLQASLYETEFRPVPLEEFLKVGSTIYSKKKEFVRTIRKGADLGGKDPDHVVELCHEVVREGHSVLLFCSSRKGCETSARHIAKFLPPFSVLEKENATGPRDGNAAVEELRKTPAGLDPVLRDTLPAGVAYHHAGLTVEERDVVEACFKSGVVRVLVATSTLAAGVNLPARRVIFRQPKIGRDFLDATRYRQMAGRAGRAGIDTKGESILICKPEEAKRMEGIIRQDCKPLQSCLADDKNGMMRALLEVVAGGAVQSAADVQRYVRCTLLNATQPFDQVVKAAQDSLRWLCHQHLLEWDSTSRLYTTTPLGRAAFSSSLSPEESLVVFEDLAKAREGFVLASDLHLLYEVTPTYVDLEPDWGIFYQRFVELSPIDQAVGNRVGVLEPFLLRMAHGGPLMQQRSGGRARSGKASKGKVSPVQKSRWNSPNGVQLSVEQMIRVCKRFYVALMLSKLVQEVGLMEICDSFKVPRGTVQGLQESAGRFAGMIAAFCERLGWSDMEGLVSKFQKRVSFGVKSEIVDLTEIPFVKGARARALFKAGVRSVQAVAEATLPELIKALYAGTTIQGDNSSRGQQWLQMGVARKIKNGARRIALDRAEEARAAAFSAFQALGVQVPASLALPLPSPAAAAQSSEGTILEPLEGSDIHGVARTSVAPAGMLKPESPWVNAVSGLNHNVIQNDDPKSRQKELRSHEDSKEESVLEAVNTLQSMLETDSGSRPHKVLSTSGLLREAYTEQAKPEHVRNMESANIEHSSLEENSSLHGSGLQPMRGNRAQPEQSNFKRNKEVVGAFFTGSLIAREEIVVEEVLPARIVEPSRGPIDVDMLPGGFDEFLTQLQGVDEFAFDLYYKTQTLGNPTLLFEIEGVALCWKNSPVYYVNIAIAPKSPDQCTLSKPSGDQGHGSLAADSVVAGSREDFWSVARARWRKVGELFSKENVTKVAWDVKGQLHALSNPGFYVPPTKQVKEMVSGVVDVKERADQLKALPPLKVQNPLVDVRVAAWLLWPDEESSHIISLEQEVKKRLPGEVAAAASRAGRWANQIGCVAHNGCCRRTAQVWALHSALWKLLLAEGLHHPLLQLEMPLVKVLAEMEMWGLGVDMEACRDVQSLLHQKLQALEMKAQELAGMTFSLSVPAEVANVLYRHLKLPVPPGCKGKQHPSTDKHALDALRERHPIADVIKEHRSLSKLLHSTLGAIIAWAKSPEPLAAFKGRSKRDDLHYIFGHWLQTSTATGRLSMEDPNLQCVEHPISFTLDDGNSSENVVKVVEVNARQLFVPSEEGWVVMSADYSQIEVRLMAHFSGDPSLVALLSKPTGDLFRLLAAQWTGLADSSISEKQREHTKRLVYGMLYGMGVNTLSEHLQCPLPEAQEMLKRFKATFPVVSAWLLQAVESCRQKGYVKTLGGRKRYLEKINHGKWGEQAKAERQAVNSICQGSAADLIKLAMIKVHHALSTSASLDDQPKHEEHECWHFQGSCRLLLQIHDELVFEVEKRVVKSVARMLHFYMEGAATLRVPLQAKIQVGTSWGSLQPYTDDTETTP